MPEIEASTGVLALAEELTLIGALMMEIFILWVLLKIERARADKMTEDIVSDWKNLRGIEDRNDDRQRTSPNRFSELN